MVPSIASMAAHANTASMLVSFGIAITNATYYWPVLMNAWHPVLTGFTDGYRPAWGTDQGDAFTYTPEPGVTNTELAKEGTGILLLAQERGTAGRVMLWSDDWLTMWTSPTPATADEKRFIDNALNWMTP